MNVLLKDKSNWQDVVDDCRVTVGKPPLGHEPSASFKEKILLAEHTPIRMVVVRWKFEGIKSWIATHFARHMFYKNITSQREDRTGVPRDDKPQSALVDMVCEANAQNMIDVSRKRLCYMAHKETREAWEKVVDEVAKVEPELALCCVPNCVYRCGCPELTPCGRWNKFLKFAQDMQIDVASLSIEERYKLWQTYLHPIDDSQTSYNAYKDVFINRVV